MMDVRTLAGKNPRGARRVKRASLERKRRGRPTVLVLDEIHRFNRAQQDAFLSHVECGDIVLIGSPQSAFAIPESAAKPAK